MRVLQQETQVSLNAVDDIEKFTSDIIHGRWDAVIEQIKTLKLPVQKLTDLFEQIILELAELKEFDLARSILRQTPAMSVLKRSHPDKYLRLEHLLQRSYFDEREAYPHGSSKEKRRAEIAEELRSEVVVVPPARLMCLLTQALKWQQHIGHLPKGSQYDLFRGSAPTMAEEEEKFPNRNDKVIRFGNKSHAECSMFSPDGIYLVTGSVDGFVEVWDYDTGKLAKDLKFQAEDDFMMHDESVLCLAFSRDGDLLASGSAEGCVKVWRLRTGACVKKFPTAHTKGVTCVEFARDGTQLLTASFDQTARIHGLKSGRTLKEFRGHRSFVNKAIYSEDMNRIITASSDATVKVWDAKTTDCMSTFRPSQGPELSVLNVALLPKSPDRLVVCNKSNTIYITSFTGQVVRSYSNNKNEQGDFITFHISPSGRFLYALAEDCILYIFNIESGQLEHALKLHDNSVLGFALHPHRNILSSFNNDSTLKIWRA
eukprot:TRINITY_DN3272_c0_g1_i3.p1 TRINITY_DN3272_c0_g1~~TRINITY_DN3272_c0_g1_i3.p1  ORF type:complete len:528 (-),score=127.99 TRINITY_DN3272_c0_g1_i3:26-1480(-)